jgi:hypothetical protein
MFEKTMVRGLIAAAMWMAIVLAFPFLVSVAAHGQQVVLTETTPGAGTVTVPAGVEWADVTVQC